MDYFGIKTPNTDYCQSYIWWIAATKQEAWISFFEYPNAKKEMNAHRLPLAEAIHAYESIGYQCVELDVVEK